MLTAQALEHTQGELLIQVRESGDLKKIISTISSLRRSQSNQSIQSLSTEDIWYKVSFDYTIYNENEVLAKVRSNHKTIAAQFNTGTRCSFKHGGGRKRRRRDTNDFPNRRRLQRRILTGTLSALPQRADDTAGADEHEDSGNRPEPHVARQTALQHGFAGMARVHITRPFRASRILAHRFRLAFVPAGGAAHEMVAARTMFAPVEFVRVENIDAIGGAVFAAVALDPARNDGAMRRHPIPRRQHAEQRPRREEVEHDRPHHEEEREECDAGFRAHLPAPA